MFFPRLRRRAKWVFLALAIVFAGGFLVFGVGTGVQGSSLGDILQDVFQDSGAGDQASVAEAQEQLRENPGDAEARLALANALQAEGRTAEAAAELSRYTEARPRDTDALQQLATLYNLQAVEARRQAEAAQVEAQQQRLGQQLEPATDDPFAQRLAQDPISEALAGAASERAIAAGERAQAAYRREAGVWQRLTLLQPDEAGVFLQLGQASQFAGDSAEAIAAYERFLELAPDDANAPVVRQILEGLRGTEASG